MKNSELGRFVRAWIDAPLRTGAIAPSSSELAQHMAFAAALRRGSSVIELGPGTGVVTEALLEAGVDEAALTLVEANEDFARHLAKHYSAATVLTGDAFAILEQMARDDRSVSAIVSSLPLYVYPSARREALCQNALRLVGPDGRLVQFTYGPVSPISRKGSVRAVCSRRIWNNLPPAVVWTYQAA